MLEDVTTVEFSSPIHKEIVKLVLFFLEQEDPNLAINLAAAGMSLDLVGLYLHEVSAHLDEDGLAEKIAQFADSARADGGDRIITMARRLPLAKRSGRTFIAGVVEFMPPRSLPKREVNFGGRLLKAYSKSAITGKLSAPLGGQPLSWSNFEKFRRSDDAKTAATEFKRRLVAALHQDNSLPDFSYGDIFNQGYGLDLKGTRMERAGKKNRPTPELFAEDRFAGRFRLTLMLFALFMVSFSQKSEGLSPGEHLEELFAQYYPTTDLGKRLSAIPLLARMVSSWLVHPRSLPTLTRGFGPSI